MEKALPKIQKLETMKLWNIVFQENAGLYGRVIGGGAGRPGRPNAIVNCVIATDHRYAQLAVNRNYRRFTLDLVEEMEPTQSNMIGLLYTKYLSVKDRELEEIDDSGRPVHFESVLAGYSDDFRLTSLWRRYAHVSDKKITLSEHINENRDRKIVMELIEDRLKIRRDLIQKEIEALNRYDIKLKNLNLLPIND